MSAWEKTLEEDPEHAGRNMSQLAWQRLFEKDKNEKRETVALFGI